jgi:serine/threonine protein kinase
VCSSDLELIEGQGLRSYCQTARLDLRARVELVQRIAEAVSFAHRNLVVHRDLKPANVLIDGEGQVKLLDFGIAKLMDADEEGAARTQTLVTPDAAAPELLRGGAVTAATDVYGLGLILYELLTGEPPYDLGAKPLALALQQVLDRELPPPSQRGRLFPAALLRGDLDAIALKALRHDPLQRYATAEALLDDLRRWRAGEPVLARGDGGWYLMSRYIRRHRLVFAAGGALLLSLALGSAGIAWQAREAAVQRDQALAAAQRTKAISD